MGLPPAEGAPPTDRTLWFVDGVRPTDSALRADQREKVRLLVEAIDALPRRCRKIVILRKLELIPQSEVAARLGISEKGVENLLSRGLSRCRQYLRKRGVHNFLND